ncbi:MAG: type II secretion system secretin GspD [Verrucomicrobiota bacterium]|jgi:general secretion pathway protein D
MNLFLINHKDARHLACGSGAQPDMPHTTTTMATIPSILWPLPAMRRKGPLPALVVAGALLSLNLLAPHGRAQVAPPAPDGQPAPESAEVAPAPETAEVAPTLPVAPRITPPAGISPNTQRPIPSRNPQRSHPALRSDDPVDPNMLVEVTLPMTDLSVILEYYASLCRRVLVARPTDMEGTRLSLQAPDPMPLVEALEAMDAVLAHNGFALQPIGDRFLKLVKTDEIKSGTPLSLDQPTLHQRENLVTQLVKLDFVDAAQVQADLSGLLHTYGEALVLTDSNALLITETEANIHRLLQIIEFLDQPGRNLVEWRIYELENAMSSEIAAQLQEIITVETAAAASAAARNPNLRRQVAPGQPPQPQAPAGTDASRFARGMTEEAIVEGQVKLVADDRTNNLIVITRPVNFPFLDEMIGILDKEIAPDIEIKIVPLYYADAEELASILSGLVGGSGTTGGRATGATRTGITTGQGIGQQRTGGLTGTGTRTGTTSRTGTSSRLGTSRNTTSGMYGARQVDTSSGLTRRPGGGIEGELADELLEAQVQISADLRSNSLIIMASTKDFKILEQVISQLDVQLAQVMIEVIIGEVSLSDTDELGVDWLQKSFTAVSEQNIAGFDVREPVFSFGGGLNGAGTVDGASILNADSYPGGSGLGYYFSSNDFNIDVALRALSTSTDFKVLSRPLIVTSHNQPGSIIVGTSRPIVTSTYSSVSTTDSFRSNVDYRDIGIQLDILPKINAGKVVVLEISQTIDNIAGEVLIDNNSVPVISRREANAFVTVRDNQTVVLGGLMEERENDSVTGVPILKDIPLLGALFRTKKNETQRTELLVFITPHVMSNEFDLAKQTKETVDDAKGLNQMDAFQADRQRIHTDLDEAGNILIDGMPDRQHEVTSETSTGTVWAQPMLPTGTDDGESSVVTFPADEDGTTSGSWKIIVPETEASKATPGSILDQLRGADKGEPVLPVMDPEIAIREAQALVQAGEFEVAEASLRNTLAAQPDLFEARRMLAQILLHKGDLDGAADELHSALSVNPYYADAWYQLHRIYTEQDNAQMSATAAEAFLSVADPQDPRRDEFHSPTPEPEEPIYQAIPLEELPETVEPEPDSDNDLTDRQPLPGGDA